MNTARIVVLIIALSAGGVAVSLARGSDEKSHPAGPVAQLPTAAIMVESDSEEQAPKRGAGINVVRYVASPSTAPK